MRVLVAGALANKPRYGGEAWARLAWIRGLEAIGVETLFVERIATDTLQVGLEANGGVPPGMHQRFFEGVADRFGLGRSFALLGTDDRSVCGPAVEEVVNWASEADLLLNISGHLRPGDPVFEAVQRCAYVDLDPGFTQIWHVQGVGDLGLDRHQIHFTVGWNVGRPGCTVPTGGIEWIPLRPPVVLEDWPARPLPTEPKLTTVASWRGAYGPVEHEGITYGPKAHEFRKFIGLPAMVNVPLEIALDIQPGDAKDRDALLSSGWRLVPPTRVAASPEDFREYLAASSGEFSVAQNVYSATQSGWFSDRSARYLASGRPIIVQDTGLAPDLPLGEGLLVFETPEEAAAGVRDVLADPESQAVAARQIAEEFFDARRVLPRVLDAAMDSPARASSRVSLPASKERKSILVSGMIAGIPGQGGASWAVLQYVLGLLRLGHDVYFVEEIESSGPQGLPLDHTASWSYLQSLAGRFGITDRVALLARGSRETAGLEYADLLAIAKRSRLLLNLSGTLTDPDLLQAIPLRLYVDLDPAFTQIWHSQGIDMGLSLHTHFATVGLSVGNSDCAIPTCGVDWQTTLPPVVLDEWPQISTPPGRDAWTTISHWRGYGTLDWEGRRLGQKAHAFRRLFALPERSGDRFEIALAIDPEEVDDLRSLSSHGWSLTDPSQVAGDPQDYRRFVGESAGEIGIAKEGYVVSSSGWFSDRSACYLASGRPVVAQDTGLSEYLPTGSGLLSFESVDEAAWCVTHVRESYARHSRAARAFAEAHLDARTVLPPLLAEVER